MRFIDFDPCCGKLYSASDDGDMKVWDLNCEKLMHKYRIYMEERRYNSDSPQLTHPAEFYTAKSCPLALAASRSGNLVFTSFSDNTLRMIDVRCSDKEGNLLSKPLSEGGHSSFVKSIAVS